MLSFFKKQTEDNKKLIDPVQRARAHSDPGSGSSFIDAVKPSRPHRPSFLGARKDERLEDLKTMEALP